MQSKETFNKMHEFEITKANVPFIFQRETDLTKN